MQKGKERKTSQVKNTFKIALSNFMFFDTSPRLAVQILQIIIIKIKTFKSVLGTSSIIII